MNSPDFFSEDNAADRFDDALRAQLGDVEVTPAPAAWETLRTQLPTPRPAPAAGRGRLATFASGLLTGALLWWGGSQAVAPSAEVAGPGAPLTVPPAASVPQVAPSVRQITGSARQIAESVGQSTARARRLAGSARHLTGSARRFAGSLGQSTGHARPVAETTGQVAGSAPAAPGVAALAGVEARDSVLQQETRAYLAPLAQVADTGRAARLRTLIAEQTQALAALTARLDSVKQALPETPPALAVALAPSADSLASAAWPTLPPVHSPWALLLTAETTPSWAVLPTRSPVAPMQEQTLTSFGQSALLQYQAAPRWRLRAGVGQSTVQTQLRTVAERTGERTVTDSTMTTDVRDYTVTTVSDIVRHDTIFIYEPILNGSVQIIGYDTSFVVATDSVRSFNTTTVRDTVHRKVVTRRTEAFRERQQQQFRPTYRFWTLPVALNYAVFISPRWRLGATVGGQVAVFRGGTRPVLVGSDHYELQRVGPRDGPYRPVSLSLSAGLEAEYRLSSRLSAMVAPTVRWSAVPAARGGSGPRPLLPAAVVGLSWGF